MSLSTLAVIPARAGSKRIERKNMQQVAGRTLVAHAVSVGLETCTRVVVSSDDPEILELAYKIGAHPLYRPASLAGDEVSMTAVLRHIVELHAIEKACPMVLLQPTTPQRKAEDVSLCLRAWSKGEVVCTVNNDGRRNGAAYVITPESIECPIWTKRWIAIQTDDYIDINLPEDLEEARRILGP